MISDKSEYYYVTGLDEIIINGSVMPLRTGPSAGNLRGEDIAFLKEFYAERKAAMSGDSSLTPENKTFSKDLDFWQKANAIINAAAAVGWCCDDSEVYQGKWAFTPDGAGVDGVLEILGIPRKTTPSLDSLSREIVRSEIETCFEAIRGCSRLVGFTGSGDVRHDAPWRAYRETNAGGSWVDYTTSYACYILDCSGWKSTDPGSTWNWEQTGYRFGHENVVAMTRGSGSSRFAQRIFTVWKFWVSSIENRRQRQNFTDERYGHFIAEVGATWRDMSTIFQNLANQFNRTSGMPVMFDCTTDSDSYVLGNRRVCNCSRFMTIEPAFFLIDLSDRTLIP